MKKVIADYVEREDIDLLNKLDNLCGHGQISNRVFEVCNKKEMFEEIEQFIWEIITGDTGDENLSLAENYIGLECEYEAKDERDLWSARLYNNDELYMYAIEDVLDNEYYSTEDE